MVKVLSARYVGCQNFAGAWLHMTVCIYSDTLHLKYDTPHVIYDTLYTIYDTLHIARAWYRVKKCVECHVYILTLYTFVYIPPPWICRVSCTHSVMCIFDTLHICVEWASCIYCMFDTLHTCVEWVSCVYSDTLHIQGGGIAEGPGGSWEGSAVEAVRVLICFVQELCVCICIHVYICIYTYIYTHTYIYVYVYIYHVYSCFICK